MRSKTFGSSHKVIPIISVATECHVEKHVHAFNQWKHFLFRKVVLLTHVCRFTQPKLKFDSQLLVGLILTLILQRVTGQCHHIHSNLKDLN